MNGEPPSTGNQTGESGNVNTSPDIVQKSAITHAQDGNDIAQQNDGFIYDTDFSNYHTPIGKIQANLPTPADLVVFDEVIIAFLEEQHIPGASLCLAHKQHIIYTQTYGWATHSTPVQSQHKFRIASITKPLTAAAVMKLTESNKLTLNQKVFGPKGILSEFSPSARGDRRLLRITVKHLLQHSAGWDRDIVGDAVFWKHVGSEMGEEEPVKQTVLIEYMMSQKLQFTPGSRHAYCNLGYLVLGRIVERLAKVSYGEFVQKMLSEVEIHNMELGRTRKTHQSDKEVEYFCDVSRPHTPLLVPSVYKDEGLVLAPYGSFAMETGDSDGGWVATATDLLLMLLAMENSTLISKSSFRQMKARPSYARGATACLIIYRWSA